jgi:hypothetical protein
VTGIDSALAAATEGAGVNLGSHLAAGVAEIKAIGGSGRFDWLPSASNRLVVFAHGALVEGSNLGSGRNRYPTVGAGLTGVDVAAGAALTSVLSAAFALELRASVEVSRREYTAPDTALTIVPAGPVAFGTDPWFAGEFRQSGFRVVETVHVTRGMHRFKLGGGAGIRAVRGEYLPERAGVFVLGDPGRLSAVDGAFSQTVGRSPLAQFTGVEAGGFVQDRWLVAPGLALQFGLRVDWEKFPPEKITLNQRWFERTALGNDSLDASRVKLGPRGGVSWDVGNRHRWFVLAGGGVYHGVVDADALVEAITTPNGAEMRRGVGLLGRWPVPPDSSAAPIRGPAFALLHPDVAAPRTSRATFGVSGTLGGGAAVHLAASYRHTDYLVRRHDLNRLPVAAASDQYGRPLYGTLVQAGEIVAATPGSNRRFPEFDAVTALDQDGYSDYVGFTMRLERRVGRLLTLSTGYTYSQTTDNWLGARAGPDARVTPFPDSLEGRDWADGRSDFDVPHRFVLGADLDFGRARLAAFYSFRSGYPFTPGFRDGVDANADGSWQNDPAFVDDQMAGVSDLYPAWPCLLAQAGRFAERNACRGPTVQRLDLRLALGPFHLGYPIAVTVDVLNVLDAEYADVDRALYLVDPAGSLTTDPVTGVVAVPLVVNPSFGKVIRRLGSGRALRLGIRVNYD